MPKPFDCVRQKKPPAACLLAGEEVQLIEEVRLSIRRHFAPQDHYRVALDYLKQSDLMIGKNKGLFSNSNELYELISQGKPSADALLYISDMSNCVQPPDCLLVVIIDWDYKYKKAAWFKKLSDKLSPVICSRQPPAQAAGWIEHWATESGLTLTADDVRFLSSQTEGNLIAAKQAIIKLALTDSAAADEKRLRQVLTDGARYDIFDLSDAIYSGDGARALSVLRQLRAAGVADVLIQWNLVNIINNVAALRDGKRVFLPGRQTAALESMAKHIGRNALYALTRHAAYTDRVIKGVAGGDSDSMLCALAARLTAYRRGVKMTLPRYPV